MKALIKLTQPYGEAIWVNPDYISTMARGESCTHLCVANDSTPFFVRESPIQIIQMIQEAYEERLD